jgi:hypothetical protein
MEGGPRAARAGMRSRLAACTRTLCFLRACTSEHATRAGQQAAGGAAAGQAGDGRRPPLGKGLQPLLQAGRQGVEGGHRPLERAQVGDGRLPPGADAPLGVGTYKGCRRGGNAGWLWITASSTGPASSPQPFMPPAPLVDFDGRNANAGEHVWAQDDALHVGPDARPELDLGRAVQEDHERLRRRVAAARRRPGAQGASHDGSRVVRDAIRLGRHDGCWVAARLVADACVATVVSAGLANFEPPPIFLVAPRCIGSAR